ncbi:MAG TPA: VIT1/CCC1 transporter family protein [Candidatus Eremiobacteraceae bacterium]
MKSSVSKTDLNLWMAFIDEAKTHRLYNAFAQQAMREGHPEVAEAFMEAAGAEIIHAMMHLQALGAVKSSVENLRQVVEEEAVESRVTYPRYIREAEDDGRPDAVASFQLALNREEHHTVMFKAALDTLNAKVASASPPPAQHAAQPSWTRTAHGVEKMAGPAEVTEERGRIATRSRIRELVFGAQDGILTTVGVVSSIFGAAQSNSVILLAGLASAFAGMVAMTAGSYLSSKAEDDVAASEIQREMREISERPAEELAELVEIYKRQGMAPELARDAALEVARDPRKMLAVMAREELGLDVETPSSAIKDAMVMAPSFLGGAAIPIIPYTFMHGPPALTASILAAAVALFGIGVVKARAASTNQWHSGIEAFAIGASAALLGYVIGTLIPNALGISVPGG